MPWTKKAARLLSGLCRSYFACGRTQRTLPPAIIVARAAAADLTGATFRHRAKITRMRVALRKLQRDGPDIPAGDGSAESNALVEQIRQAREQRWKAEDNKVELGKELFELRHWVLQALGEAKAVALFERWIEMAGRMEITDGATARVLACTKSEYVVILRRKSSLVGT